MVCNKAYWQRSYGLGIRGGAVILVDPALESRARIHPLAMLPEGERVRILAVEEISASQ